MRLTRSWASRASICLTLTVVMLVGSALGGCTFSTSEVGAFTIDPSGEELVYEQVMHLLDGDTLDSLIASNPFYSGAQPFYAPGSDEYMAARQAKVDEIVGLADEAAGLYRTLEPGLANLRGMYADYLTECLEHDNDVQFLAEETLPHLASSAVKQVALVEMYDALVPPTDSTELARTTVQYQKVTQAAELAGSVLQDLNDILGFSAYAIVALEGSESAEIKAANQRFDQEMVVVEELADDIEAMGVALASIDNGFAQLAAGDYLFSQEAVAFSLLELQRLDAELDEAEEKGTLDDEDLEFVRDQVAAMRAFTEWMATALDSMDTSGTLVAETRPRESLFGPSYAYAVGVLADPASQLGRGVNSGTEQQSTLARIGSGLKWTWSGVRSAFDSATTGVGVVIDSAGHVVRTVSSIPCGLYYGNSLQDVRDNIQSSAQDVFDNYYAGTSGSDTLRTAGEYLEGAGDLAKSAGDYAGSMLGDNRVGSAASWVLGNGARLTVGIVTGLGQGIYRVLDKRSTTGEVALGFLQIGLAALGGSKVTGPASRAPAFGQGVATTGVKAGKSALSWFGSKFNNSVVNNLSAQNAQLVQQALQSGAPLSGNALKQWIANRAIIETKKGVIAAAEAARAQWLAQIKEAIAKGGAAQLVHIKTQIKQSLSDAFAGSTKQGLEKWAELGGRAFGTSFSSWLDNVIGGAIDEEVTKLIAEAVQGGPEPERVAGVWKGSMTIGTVEAPPGEQMDAGEGCDLSIDLKMLEGQSFGVQFDIKLDQNGTGTVLMTGDSVDPSSGSASYSRSSGQITMSPSNKGAKMTLRGQVVANDKNEPVSMSGDFVISSGNVKITGTWKATK